MAKHPSCAWIKSILLLTPLSVLSFYLGWNGHNLGSVAKRGFSYEVLADREKSREMTSSYSSVRPRPLVILATTNKAFVDFTENWLESLRRCNIRDKVTVIAEDTATREILSRRKDINLEIVMTNETNLPEGALRFNTRDYIRLVNKRPSYIYGYLRNGIDVLFTDVDTVWLQNPLPFLVGDYDVHFERDVYPADGTAPGVICAGFAYYGATNATMDLVTKWIHMLLDEPTTPDQELLNRLIGSKAVRDSLKIHFLDRREFPNGLDYFNIKWREKNADVKPIVVHNNWVIGHDVKLKRFKNASMWYI